MIKRMRNRFIRIATLSVAAVMLLLTVILNTANFVSTDADLRDTLNLIYENEGTIPTAAYAQEPDSDPGTAPEEKPADDSANTNEAEPPEAPPGDKDRNGPFTAETPYSTRYFVLRYEDDGTLTLADLDKIAAVSQEDIGAYLTAAVNQGEGYGYYGQYRFFTAHLGENRNMAIFLDSYQAFRSMKTVLVWSLIADAACILLVLLLVILLSRRAIDPMVRSAREKKQFITDASHELKTPITVITTSLKVLEMDVGKQKWIDKALAQAEKLTGLVNSLVTLSRMDEEESPLHMQVFPISETVGETAESFRDFARERGHGLELDIAPGLCYCGDEYAVRQLVSILLDNGIKYALPDTPISLSLAKSRKGVVLCSANRCDTTQPIDTDRLFDRFYQADPSRSSSQGFGIGLSIARSIAEGHKGSISAKLEGDTILFRAELNGVKQQKSVCYNSPKTRHGSPKN